MQRRIGLAVAIFHVAFVCPAIRAAAGVIEINQAIVEADGGFPYVISEPGSYILTGNLSVPDGDTTAIEVRADDVTLDLNGFTIQCSDSDGASCDPESPLGFNGDGVTAFFNNLVIHFTLVGGLGLGDNVSIGQGLTENQLFEESVEDLAYVAGLSTVEAKGEFIEVALQMHFTHLPLVRRYQPALEQRGNQVDMREFLGGYLRVSRCVGDPIAIAGFLQAPVTPPAVAMDQTA